MRDLTELSYEFLLYIEEAAFNMPNMGWLGGDGFVFYNAIADALVRKCEGTNRFLPDRLKGR